MPVQDPADRVRVRRRRRVNDVGRTCGAGMSENHRVAPLRCVAIAVQETLPMRHDLSFPRVAAACAALPSVPR